MDEVLRKVQKASTYSVLILRAYRESHAQNVSKSKHPIGAMEELSGKVQKASTHVSGVGIDFAAVERDCAAGDVDAASILITAICICLIKSACAPR